MDNLVANRLHAYVPHTYEVVGLEPVGSACFIRTRPAGTGMDGYRDTLVLGAGLSASWADITRPRALEEHYDCSGALKIHLRMAGHSSVTDGGETPHAIDGMSCSALLQPRGARKIEIFGAGERERSVTVSCTREYLVDELGLDPAAYGGALGRYLMDDPGTFALFRAGLDPDMRQAGQCFFEPVDDRPMRRLLLQARAEDIVRRFFGHMRHDDAVDEIRPRDRAMAERVAALLADAFREPPSVRELAGLAGVSVSKLSRAFKAVQGVTMSEYLLAIRMRHAMALIRAARLPVTQVALEVGYEHAGNFSTAFRRHYGVSPRAAGVTLRGKP
ncbi:helix-turn-helix transcriptional regulator [Bordetella petrii]|uniref:helix-turn-helix transcriptional regulator n=1 Tax=Bordetella petrii TaxID=94624 RepID=UPI001E3369AA|nr:AraC family transcriptional regulator [Bordetella petrii]MCD0503813.1 AraC family transcriptional regulator [Bordetella petrii]